MPQLDTSTWALTIISMIITLFYFFQKKMMSYYYYNINSQLKPMKTPKHLTPWEKKWTKTYSPLS
uniref:ATP synthase complex subunit 8 n=1 Tax=Thryonomys swinderianus TaxID=10169 RepID=Q9B6F8_THRSW|nr:ATP synthase F0 subunit 8 [Thryonomys swinderianus]CAC27803.1 ATPase subunit 8 [Thryonomys swinderianus]